LVGAAGAVVCEAGFLGFGARTVLCETYLEFVA
jgi:hypothetical protein